MSLTLPEFDAAGAQEQETLGEAFEIVEVLMPD